MIVAIKMTSRERKLVESYAKHKGMSLSEVIKKILFETMEDEFDINEGELALREYETTRISYTQEDMKKKLGVN